MEKYTFLREEYLKLEEAFLKVAQREELMKIVLADVKAGLEIDL